MEEYYAHTENADGEWEKLELHLKKTAKLTKGYADAFGEENAGYWLGILHDAGKASILFQGVLNGKEHNVDHATAGAAIIYKMSHLLARVIYAHHDGLEWHIKDELEESCKKTGSQGNNGRFAVSGAEQYAELLKYIKPLFSGKPPNLMDNKDSYYKNLSEMLHTRMLLSCLCDADYTATASHYDNSININSEENTVNAELILDRLFEYKEDLSKRSTANSKLNKIRESVFEDCIEAAKHSPGMFTLTAPTGTGKTLALLAFAAKHSAVHKKRRIIIVLPFLSIINQNAKIYRKICGEVLEAHSMAANYEQKAKADKEELKLISEQWNSPVIITTTVKFFEAFFKSQPSNLRFLHSIADSVIIFDEAQCIAPELTGTTIETMRMMCEMFGCTVLLSTATQPAFDKRKDIVFNPYEVISAPQSLYDKTRRVSVEWKNDVPVSLERIADEMAEKQSVCCVLNRKDHTRKLFELLRKRCSDEECFHISTDMCNAHRDKVLEEITGRLSHNKPCRLVSTSCIEAGVDLDFAYMYRAFAPLEAIIQCAGRCNRNGKQSGEMIVFEPDEVKKYPSSSYENAVLILKSILTKHDVDIYNTEHIREYYSVLFEDNNYKHDKRKLEDAIKNQDFKEAERQYKFIPQSGVNVLVPYNGEIKLFEELSEESRIKGISKEWMKKAAPITVTSYYESKLIDIAEPCRIKTRYGLKPVPGWYILLSKEFYDDMTGLHFDAESSLDYLI